MAVSTLPLPRNIFISENKDLISIWKLANLTSEPLNISTWHPNSQSNLASVRYRGPSLGQLTLLLLEQNKWHIHFFLALLNSLLQTGELAPLYYRLCELSSLVCTLVSAEPALEALAFVTDPGLALIPSSFVLLKFASFLWY